MRQNSFQLGNKSVLALSTGRTDFIKTVNARDLQKQIKERVDMSQQDQVVITRRGKSAAVMVGVEGKAGRSGASDLAAGS